MTTRIGTALACFLLIAAARGFAQVVPDPGLAAEAAGRWDEAISVYREALGREPRRSDLWVRIGDIESRRGNLEASIAALERAAEAAPGNAALHSRLSQAYAAANHPAAALKAIDGALTLQPDNVAYLRASAILATWSGEYGHAAKRYRRIVQLQPTADVGLHLPRVSAWSGDTDD